MAILKKCMVSFGHVSTLRPWCSSWPQLSSQGRWLAALQDWSQLQRSQEIPSGVSQQSTLVLMPSSRHNQFPFVNWGEEGCSSVYKKMGKKNLNAKKMHYSVPSFRSALSACSRNHDISWSLISGFSQVRTQHFAQKKFSSLPPK